MPLNLYRRHRQECEAKHPEESRSGELQERSKKWTRCACPIFAAGTLARAFRRRSTGRWTWEDAKAVATAWEAAGRWDDAVVPEAVPEAEQSRPTIRSAVKAYLAEHEKNSARSTVKKYTMLMAKILAWSDHKGYVTLDQWGPQNVRECRDSWTVSPRTANRDMSIVRAFFEFCYSNEWIERNPGRLVKNPRGKAGADSRNEQKLPFTDEELALMYDVAEKRYGKLEIKWDRHIHHRSAIGVVNSYRYSWTGKDLAEFISVSVYTGLRISDVATFQISRMNENGEVHIRTTKSGAHVNTWLPEWLQAVIRRRALEVGPLIFGEHQTTDMSVITDIWRRKLNRLWRMCGPWSAKPTPHRFRHSFARILLSRPEVTVRDVAELLRNTEQMVRKHYSAWIPERQEELTSKLKKAFTDKPRSGTVIEMPKSGTK